MRPFLLFLLGAMAPWLMAQQPASIVELPEPAADRIVFEAAIPYLESDLWHTGHWELLAYGLRQGTRDFGRLQLRQLTQTMGTPLITRANDGWMRVQVTVPAGELELGALLLTSILFSSSLREDDFNAALERESRQNFAGPWEQAIAALRSPQWRPHIQEFQLLYEATFLPERIHFGVGGAFQPGAGRAAIQSRLPRRNPPRTQGLRRATTSPVPSPQRPEDVRLVERRFPAIALDGPGGPQQLMAAFVLGAGFSSHLTQSLRERRALSYRQEFLMVPTLRGYQPTLRVAVTPEYNEEEAWDRIREAVREDLASLTEADVERARTLLLQALRSRLPFHPLMLDAESLIAPDLEGRVTLATYWNLVGTTLTLEQMEALVESVTLEDVLEQIERWMNENTTLEVFSTSQINFIINCDPCM